jgi:hypothetical protein
VVPYAVTGTATIPLLEPATAFGERLYQVVDVRLSKAFRVNRVRIKGMLDVANALNASTVLLQNNTYGPSWLRPTWILSGRIIKPSVQLDF